MIEYGDPEPTVDVYDRHGDRWHRRSDGLWETPETALYPWHKMRRAWFPMRPVEGAG